jgi:O-antigen/teichoic acid export membrane protein
VAHVSGVHLFGQIGASAPEAIIGRAEGVVSVAFFSRAGALIELFNKLVLYSVWPVLGPFFAQRARETGGVQGSYVTGTLYLTVIAWPILFLMGLLAFPAVRIIYGAQWVQSVPLAQVLCLAAAISVSYHLTKDTLIAIGRMKECNYLQIKVQVLRVAGVLMVVPFGLPGASWGIVAATTINTVITHRALNKATGLTLRDLSIALLPSLRLATFCVLPAWALTTLFPPGEHNFVWVGLAASAASVATWILLIQRSGHPLWYEIQGLLQRLRRNRPATR